MLVHINITFYGSFSCSVQKYSLNLLFLLPIYVYVAATAELGLSMTIITLFCLIQPLSYNIVDDVFAAKILNLLWDQSVIKKLNSFDIITLWEWIVVICNEFTSFYVEYFHSHFQANCVNKIYARVKFAPFCY